MIRDAAHADIHAIVALGELMHAESPHYRALSWDAGKVAEMVARLIDSPHGLALVLERGDQIIGGVLALAVEHWSSRDLVACDLAMFVRPECRGGIAAARLLESYRLWAESLHCRLIQFGVMTGVHVEQTEALAMRLGWRRQGVVLCA